MAIGSIVLFVFMVIYLGLQINCPGNAARQLSNPAIFIPEFIFSLGLSIDLLYNIFIVPRTLSVEYVLPWYLQNSDTWRVMLDPRNIAQMFAVVSGLLGPQKGAYISLFASFRFIIFYRCLFRLLDYLNTEKYITRGGFSVCRGLFPPITRHRFSNFYRSWFAMQQQEQDLYLFSKIPPSILKDRWK